MLKTKNIKRKLTMLVAASLMVIGLVGCGNNKPVTVSDLVNASEVERSIKKKEQSGDINIKLNTQTADKEDQSATISISQKTVIDNMDSDSKVNITIERPDQVKNADADEGAEFVNDFISSIKDREVSIKTRSGNVQISSNSLKNIFKGYLETVKPSDDGKENPGRAMVGFMAEALPAKSYINIPGAAMASTNPANIILGKIKNDTGVSPIMNENGNKLSADDMEKLNNLYNEFAKKAFGSYAFVNMSRKGNTLTYKATGNELKKELANFEKYVKENKDTIKTELIELSKKANLIQNKKELSEEELSAISRAFDKKIEETFSDEAKKNIKDLKDEDINITITIVSKKDGSKVDMNI